VAEELYATLKTNHGDIVVQLAGGTYTLDSPLTFTLAFTQTGTISY